MDEDERRGLCGALTAPRQRKCFIGHSALPMTEGGEGKKREEKGREREGREKEEREGEGV